MWDKIRKIENLHIVFWLLKDASWASGFKPLGMAMIFPTLAVGVYVTWKLRSSRIELAHNLAVLCWIIANSLWMTEEFFFEDKNRTPAIVFFLIGITFLGLYYGSLLFKKSSEESNH